MNVIDRPYKRCVQDMLVVERIKVHTSPEVLKRLAQIDPNEHKKVMEEFDLALVNLLELNASDLLDVCMLRLSSHFNVSPIALPAQRSGQGKR